MAARIARKKPAPKPEPVVEEQSPPPPPSLWRRLFPALFFMGVLVAMVYAFYDPDHKSTPRPAVKAEKEHSSKAAKIVKAEPAKIDMFKRRYEAFKAEFAELQADDADRDDFLAISQDFYDLYVDAKDWPNRPAALYRAAEALEYSGKKADAESDYKNAVDIYEKLIQEFPHSVLADDALYAAARVWAFSLDKPKVALRHLETLREKYPQGDKYAVGMELRKKLLPPPAVPKKTKAEPPKTVQASKKPQEDTSSKEAGRAEPSEDGFDFFGIKQGMLLAIESFFEDEPLQDPTAKPASKTAAQPPKKLSRAEAEAQAMLMLSVDHEHKDAPKAEPKEKIEKVAKAAEAVKPTKAEVSATVVSKAEIKSDKSSVDATKVASVDKDVLPLNSVPELVYKPILMPASLFMSQAVHVLADLQQSPPTLMEPQSPKIPPSAKEDVQVATTNSLASEPSSAKSLSEKTAPAKPKEHELIKPVLAVAHDKANVLPKEDKSSNVAEVKKESIVKPTTTPIDAAKIIPKPKVVAQAEVKSAIKPQNKSQDKSQATSQTKAENKSAVSPTIKNDASAKAASKPAEPPVKKPSGKTSNGEALHKTEASAQEEKSFWHGLAQSWQEFWQEEPSPAPQNVAQVVEPKPHTELSKEPQKDVSVESKAPLVAEASLKDAAKNSSVSAQSKVTAKAQALPNSEARPVVKPEPKPESKSVPKAESQTASTAKLKATSQTSQKQQVEKKAKTQQSQKSVAPKPAPLVVPKPKPTLVAEKKGDTSKKESQTKPKADVKPKAEAKAKPETKPKTPEKPKAPVQVAKLNKGQEAKKPTPAAKQPEIPLLGQNDALSQEELNKRVRNAPKGDLAAQLGLASVRTVYVDIGHGGKDQGTAHNGLIESEVVLDMGKRVGELLKSQGFNVIYSRVKNVFLPLSSRSVKANDAGADLFVSIHMNAFHNGTIQGFETYYLDFSRNSEASRVATLENSVSDRSLGDLQNVLAKMLLNVRTSESRELASSIQKSTIQALRGKGFKTKDGGTRSAPFHVLIGTSMPAVLVELGYCTHKTEAVWLKRSDYRQILARGIVQGIVKYKKSLEKQSSSQFALTPKTASGK